MKRTLKRISLLSVAIVVTVSMSSVAPAFADDGQPITLPEDSQQIALVDEGQQAIISEDSQQMRIGLMPVYYKVVNVKSLTPEWANVGVAEGIPTMILKIEKSKAISVTYSATFGATYGQINAAVGWTYGEDVTISIGGDYPVPKTYNGHKVKSAKLTAYTKINVKSYQVEKHNETGGITLSTGKAKKAVNYLRYEVKLYFEDGGSVTISV